MRSDPAIIYDIFHGRWGLLARLRLEQASKQWLRLSSVAHEPSKLASSSSKSKTCVSADSAGPPKSLRSKSRGASDMPSDNPLIGPYGDMSMLCSVHFGTYHEVFLLNTSALFYVDLCGLTIARLHR